jgi:hypothetical protein
VVLVLPALSVRHLGGDLGGAMKTRAKTREDDLTERAIARWMRAGRGQLGALNQPARDYCGVVSRATRRGRQEYVHVGNSYHTFALYRVTAADRLVLMPEVPMWVEDKIYGIYGADR